MSTETSNITLVILAAGASSRMGSPKQLLPWGNGSLITHAVKNALKTKANEVIVVLGANYDTIFHEINHFPITVVFNEEWELGLGRSIASAIDYINEQLEKPNGVLITLADQPLISTHYLNELISNFKINSNQILATSYQGNKYGVPVLFDSCYFSQLSQLNDDFGAKLILDANKSSVKVFNPPVKNVDLDSKEDYEKFLKNKTI